MAFQKIGHCVIKDDMTEILTKMQDADVVVFATPVYFYGMCGAMKTFSGPHVPSLSGQTAFSGSVLNGNCRGRCRFWRNCKQGILHRRICRAIALIKRREAGWCLPPVLLIKIAAFVWKNAQWVPLTPKILVSPTRASALGACAVWQSAPNMLVR